MPGRNPKGTPAQYMVPLDPFSGPYAYATLPPSAYPPYPYPVYPQYFYPPPGPPLSNPKFPLRIYDPPSPPPENELHDLLNNEHTRDFYWDVRTPVSKYQYREPSGEATYIKDAILDEEASGPKGREMRITCDRYKWTIDIKRPSGQTLTLRAVLEAIYNCLHEPLTEEEWNELSSGEKRNAHISRGIRLTHDKTSFNIDGRIKRVDVLGERTTFSGLRPDDKTDDWVMILSNRPSSRSSKA